MTLHNQTVPVKIAMVGCGFVADYYMANIKTYSSFTLVGVFDIDSVRLKQFTEYYNVRMFESYEEILNDTSIDIILNLTNPREHYSVSKQALIANKHVYSEKPLAMNIKHANELVDMANQRNLILSSAPCNLLGKSLKTLEYAVNQGLIGKVRLVYAELDDGLVHKMPFKKWTSVSGARWPYRDEFEVGCTLEHAGYQLGWLIKVFGNVESVTAFSDVTIANKVPGERPLQPADTPDVSIATLKFNSGIVARLTTTIVAPHDHTIRIFGDDGVITLTDCWDNNEHVYYQKYIQIRRKRFLNPIKTKVKLPQSSANKTMKFGNTKMDFLLGVDEISRCVTAQSTPILDSAFSLHVNEIALILQSGNSVGAIPIQSKAYS